MANDLPKEGWVEKETDSLKIRKLLTSHSDVAVKKITSECAKV